MTGAYKPTDFFETSAMLITLVLLGKYLESVVSVICCVVLCCAVPCCAVLCHGVPCCACSAVLGAAPCPWHCDGHLLCSPSRRAHSCSHARIPPLPATPPPLPQAKGKTSEAITKLCQLAPPTALLLTLDDNGDVVSEREVSTELVHKGDVLKVCLHGVRGALC